LFGAFKHLDVDDKRQFTIELISNEALKPPLQNVEKYSTEPLTGQFKFPSLADLIIQKAQVVQV
jgi:hypothetical protein